MSSGRVCAAALLSVTGLVLLILVEVSSPSIVAIFFFKPISLLKNIWLIPPCGEEYCSPSKPSNTDKRNLKITTLAEVVGG